MVDNDMTMSDDIKFIEKEHIVEVLGKIDINSLKDMEERVAKKIKYYHDSLVGKTFKRL